MVPHTNCCNFSKFFLRSFVPCPLFLGYSYRLGKAACQILFKVTLYPPSIYCNRCIILDPHEAERSRSSSRTAFWSPRTEREETCELFGRSKRQHRFRSGHYASWYQCTDANAVHIATWQRISSVLLDRLNGSSRYQWDPYTITLVQEDVFAVNQ